MKFVRWLFGYKGLGRWRERRRVQLYESLIADGMSDYEARATAWPDSETPKSYPYIPPEARRDLTGDAATAMIAFCKACPQCSPNLQDTYPDCLGDGDYSPDGHMPACLRCIEAYELITDA